MIHAPERQKQFWVWLAVAPKPVTGSELADRLGVSRQIIVSDMNALREKHPEIVATRRGYCLSGATVYTRVFKVFHSDKEIGKELELAVNAGGYVKDVFVYHRAYGRLTAALNIRTCDDVKVLLEKMQSGKSRSLLSTASGYHYHTVESNSVERLDAVEAAWKEHGFLLDVAPDAESIS